jgi:hypothetical protein
LKNTDFGVVDGDTFDCSPTPDKTLREAQDPRQHTNVEWGRQIFEQAALEVIEEVKKLWY